MTEKLYPITLEFSKKLGDGVVSSSTQRELIDARNAIHIKIEINRNDYPVEEITKALNEVFQKVAQCFCE